MTKQPQKICHLKMNEKDDDEQGSGLIMCWVRYVLKCKNIFDSGLTYLL